MILLQYCTAQFTQRGTLHPYSERLRTEKFYRCCHRRRRPTHVRSSTKCASIVASVSAASFAPAGQLAPESIVASFGSNLSTSTEFASSLPLPAELAGVSVRIRDSVGIERPASLFYVSANQINFLMPPGTAPGTGIVSVRNRELSLLGRVEVASVAPSVFTANSTGKDCGRPGFSHQVRRRDL